MWVGRYLVCQLTHSETRTLRSVPVTYLIHIANKHVGDTYPYITFLQILQLFGHSPQIAVQIFCLSIFFFFISFDIVLSWCKSADVSSRSLVHFASALGLVACFFLCMH